MGIEGAIDVCATCSPCLESELVKKHNQKSDDANNAASQEKAVKKLQPYITCNKGSCKVSS